MKLAFLKNIFKPSSEKADYLLTLILRADLVKAVVYERIAGKISIVGVSEVPLDRLIDDIDVEELLEICDKAIGLAEDALPHDVQATKTIFGIKEDWQKNGKIQKHFLDKLRRIKENLELTPLGFIVISEAIGFLIQAEEGAPVNAVLVELGRKVLTVSLLRATHIAESKSVLFASDTGESLPQEIEKTLKGFSSFEVLPSRIILFNGDIDPESIKQECIAFPWTKSLPFLHVPRVEVLPIGIDEKAVILGISSEMGLMFEQEKTEVSKAPDEEIPKETHEMELIEEELAFGFKQDEEMSVVQEETAIPTTAKKFKMPRVPQINLPFALITSYVSAFFKSLSLPKLPEIPIKGIPLPRRILFIPSIIFLVAAIIIFSYLFLLKASVNLTVIPKIVEDERAIIIDPNLTGGESSDRIKGEVLTTQQEGSKTAPVNGQKEVGDKAKGSIKIGNTSEIAKTFPNGTVLLGPQNLKFELTDSVTIASRSAGSFEIPSTIVNIKALQIGEESNLPANTSLTFSDFSSSLYFAQTTGGLSGGSKKVVTVVTKKDQDNLIATLSAQLRGQAFSDLSKKEQDFHVIDVLSGKSIDKKIDKKIDEEAKNISASLKIEFQVVGFKEKNLQTFLTKILQEKVGQGDYTISQDNLDLKVISFEKNKDGTMKADVKVKAKFLPKVDLAKIKKTISGKAKKEAVNYLKALPNVSDVVIKISPQLPLFSNNLPLIESNIRLTVKAKNQ